MKISEYTSDQLLIRCDKAVVSSIHEKATGHPHGVMVRLINPNLVDVVVDILESDSDFQEAVIDALSTGQID